MVLLRQNQRTIDGLLGVISFSLRQKSSGENGIRQGFISERVFFREFVRHPPSDSLGSGAVVFIDGQFRQIQLKTIGTLFIADFVKDPDRFRLVLAGLFQIAFHPERVS